MKKSITEAVMSALSSEIIHETDIVDYDKLEIYKILLSLRKSGISERLYKKYLAPLIKYDKTNNSDYMNFISVYCECGGHTKKISEKMYVHRNTVHYRVKKAEEILGCRLSDPCVQACMYLALSDYRLSAKN